MAYSEEASVDGAGEEEAVAATFKILVLGSSCVGKTSLIQAYATAKKPDSNHRPTLGVDFTNMVVDVRGVKVRLRVWDTAGQEKFHTFTKQFFRGAQGVMLVFDLTDMSSFRTLKMWKQTLKSEGLSDVIIIVVGNKCDQEDSRIVPKEAGEQLASQDYQTGYLETSVWTGHNVRRAFYDMAQMLIHSHNIFLPGREASFGQRSVGADDTLFRTGSPQSTQSIRLGEPPPNFYEDKKKCCLNN